LFSRDLKLAVPLPTLMNAKVLLCVCFVAVGIVVGGTVNDSEHFVAATVQHTTVFNGSNPLQDVLINLGVYEQHVAQGTVGTHGGHALMFVQSCSESARSSNYCVP
jgi:hypothetical protein